MYCPEVSFFFQFSAFMMLMFSVLLACGAAGGDPVLMLIGRLNQVVEGRPVQRAADPGGTHSTCDLSGGAAGRHARQQLVGQHNQVLEGRPVQCVHICIP